MSVIQSIITDLREKRLWPIAVALTVAIIAVPIALSKSSKSEPPPASTTPAMPAVHGTAVPSVTVDTAAVRSQLPKHAGDPFTQQAAASSAGTAGSSTSAGAGSASSSSTTTSAATSSSSGTTSSGSTSSSGSTGSSSGGSPGASPAPAAPSTPSSTPPTSPGLTSTQSFDVAVAMSNASGGFDTTDPFERLSVLPNKQQPLLIDLGVLQGGNRVLFVVQPGTQVSGPGTCLPGPIDCEILSLAPNKTESISANGGASSVSFVVTGITASENGSTAAADKARQVESAFGRALLNKSTLTALSLFQYQPSVGAVVDLRNLTVGGS